MELRLQTREEGPYTVIEVHGEVDVYTAPRLREQIVECVQSGQHHIVVDMSGVEFLDSTGLGVLVGGLKRVRVHGGSMRLVTSNPSVEKIFRITGLGRVFPMHTSLEDAVSTEVEPASSE